MGSAASGALARPVERGDLVRAPLVPAIVHYGA